MDDDFEIQAPQVARSVYIIQGAMAAGLAFFSLAVFYIRFVGVHSPPARDPEPLIRLFSVAHAVLAVSAWTASGLIYQTILRKPSGSLPAAFQTAEIARLACREGPAIFGLVVCFLAASDGLLAAKPVYWCNMFSAGAFWGFVLQNVLLEERLRELRRLRTSAPDVPPA